MRLCPFHGCNLELPDSMFCCRNHWRHLGHPDKAEIRLAYSEYLKGRLDIDTLRGIQQRVLGPRGDACKA